MGVSRFCGPYVSRLFNENFSVGIVSDGATDELERMGKEAIVA
jgi:hypothetical protein